MEEGKPRLERGCGASRTDAPLCGVQRVLLGGLVAYPDVAELPLHVLAVEHVPEEHLVARQGFPAGEGGTASGLSCGGGGGERHRTLATPWALLASDAMRHTPHNGRGLDIHDTILHPGLQAARQPTLHRSGRGQLLRTIC